VESGPDEPWLTVERRFRLWSFGVYYRKSFATESDLIARFIKALLASCQPIRDRQLVYEWHRRRKRRYQRRRQQHAEAFRSEDEILCFNS